jgi:membrane protein YqaA with SNARE-associated domain
MNQTGDKVEKRFWSRERYLQIAALLFALTLCAVLLLHRDKVAELEIYGYLGVFLISLITCSSIVVPVPGWIIVATLGAILNPVLVGIVSGVGGTIGEMTGYLLGYIFILALIPNPLFDIAGAVAGLLRFPLWKFLLFGTAGRIPKHILFAYIGVWGLQFLPL